MARCDFIFMFLFIFINYCECWVFTNISYRSESLSRGDGLESDAFNEIESRDDLRLIFPGTKWCGAGNIAMDYEDLGPLVREDKCCRQHDHCAEAIEPGNTRYNLTNRSFFTKLSCECDETFRKCLQSANKKMADKIGILYFDVIGQKCFRKDFPVAGCKTHGGWLDQKCVDYKYDLNGKQTYQWFDVPRYNQGTAKSTSKRNRG